MSDLPRLLDDPQLDPVARAVLRSAEADAPSNDRRAAVAAGLGLGALVSGGATTASASAVAWWLVPLVVVGLATSGAIGYLALRGEPAPSVAIVTTEAAPAPVDVAGGGGDRVVQPEPAPPPELPTAVAVVEPAIEPAKPVRKPKVADAPAVTPTPVPVPAPTPIDPRLLKEETDLLSEANAALRAGDPAKALAALDRHAAKFPDPVLGIEAKVIRIDAVLRTDHGAGVALGEQFLADFPKSPHAKRVRSLLGRKSR